MEQTLPVQGSIAELKFSVWAVKRHTFHTRWLQFHLGTTEFHCGVQVGDWFLNVDSYGTNWHPYRAVERCYGATYELVSIYNLGNVRTNIQKQKPANVWSIIKWWYVGRHLGWKTPDSCTTVCTNVMRQHGISVPADLVILSDIEKYLNDCIGIQRQSPDG